MRINLLSDVTSRALMFSLQGTAARHTAMAENIANVDTPGFIRTEVEFESALAATLARADREVRPQPALVSGGVLDAPTSEISKLVIRKQKDCSTQGRADGNNVDIDREMSALARNSLCHRAASEMLAARIRMLRLAIDQGR